MTTKQDYMENLKVWLGEVPAYLVYRLIEAIPDRGVYEFWQVPNHHGLCKDMGLSWANYWVIINRLVDIGMLAKKRDHKLKKELFRVNFEVIMGLQDKRKKPVYQVILQVIKELWLNLIHTFKKA
jgi:hypothetical protein